MVSRTGKMKTIRSRKERNEKRVREDIESGYGFPYWKKINTGTGSRTVATAYKMIFNKIVPHGLFSKLTRHTSWKNNNFKFSDENSTFTFQLSQNSFESLQQVSFQKIIYYYYYFFKFIIYQTKFSMLQSFNFQNSNISLLSFISNLPIS